MDDLPTPADVAALLDWPQDTEPQIAPHLSLVTTYARSYTRGAGFLDDEECEADLAAVIMSACIRSVSNPAGASRIEIGSYSELPAKFNGWTLIEQYVLHSYRRRSA